MPILLFLYIIRYINSLEIFSKIFGHALKSLLLPVTCYWPGFCSSVEQDYIIA